MKQPNAKRAEPVRSDWRALLAIIGVALCVSLPGLANNFAQDDLHLILGNERVHGLGDWRLLLSTPFWPPPFSQDLYRPLTSLLLAFEYELGVGAPIVYRLASCFLLAAVAVQFYALAKRLLPRGIALAAALLFAAHPVHVEATALAVGQSELVVGLIALLMATRYLDRRRAGLLSRRDWVVLGALYATACLVKEQGFVLPALLVCIEMFFVSGPVAARVRALAPGYAALTVLLGLLLAVRRSVLGGELAGTFTAEALVGLGVGGRALTMLRVVPEWARLLAWPAHLQADYSPQELVGSTGFGLLEGLGLALLVAALAAAWACRRRASIVTFGVAWCAVTLLPVSNVLLPTGILLAERTLLLPSVGFVLIVTGAVDWWMRRADASGGQSRNLAIACGVLVVLGVARSAVRQQAWSSEPVFAIRSVQDAPRSFRSHRGLGDLLFDLGRPQPALEEYEKAIALSPPSLAWRVRNDLAQRLRMTGDRAREADELRKSLASNPTQRDTRGYLVAALLVLGQYSDASRQCDTALARGVAPDLFRQLRATADSAARVGAPPGSIDMGIVSGLTKPSR